MCIDFRERGKEREREKEGGRWANVRQNQPSPTRDQIESLGAQDGAFNYLKNHPARVQTHFHKVMGPHRVPSPVGLSCLSGEETEQPGGPQKSQAKLEVQIGSSRTVLGL